MRKIIVDDERRTLAIVAVMALFNVGIQESHRARMPRSSSFDVSVQRVSELDENAAAGDDGSVSLASGFGRIEPLHPPVPIPPSL